MTPTASAAQTSRAAGTNITPGVRSGLPSSSAASSTRVVVGAAPCSPRPRKALAAIRSTAPPVNAEVIRRIAITHPYPVASRPSSSSDLPRKVQNGGTAAKESAPSRHRAPVAGRPVPKDRSLLSDTLRRRCCRIPATPKRAAFPKPSATM